MEKRVLRIVETYKSAVLAKNVETFMHLYAPDARVFDAWGIGSYEGAAVWRVAVARLVLVTRERDLQVMFDDVQTIGDPSFAAMSAVVTYAGISAQGQEIRAMQNRISWVRRQTESHQTVA